MQLCPYHFLPPELLHPITAIYDLRYGETEMKQGNRIEGGSFICKTFAFISAVWLLSL